ncbi:MAG: hypothetical protein M1358_05930 [Chloroflexi bacterium]|nr:hypothetical protein [Chloroflexota bacterium]
MESNWWLVARTAILVAVLAYYAWQTHRMGREMPTEREGELQSYLKGWEMKPSGYSVNAADTGSSLPKLLLVDTDRPVG